MAKVKIQGNASGTGVLTVTAPNTSTDRVITLPDGDVTLGAATPSIDDNGDATAITINSSEQVGIGTTSPNETLRVGGTVKIAPTNQTGTLAFGGTDNSNVHVGIFRGDANSLSAGNSLNLAGYSSITFSASAALVGSQTERMRVTSDGLTFNGDTAAANALDDYEEGTHTVTATCSTSGSVTLSSTNNKFTYTKIGNLVTITGRLDVSAISSPNGDLFFSLPFTVAQTGSSQNQSTAGAMFVWFPTSGDSGKWVAWADGGESVVYVRHGDGVQPPQSANLVRVSTEFRLNFSYTTA